MIMLSVCLHQANITGIDTLTNGAVITQLILHVCKNTEMQGWSASLWYVWITRINNSRLTRMPSGLRIFTVVWLLRVVSNYKMNYSLSKKERKKESKVEINQVSLLHFTTQYLLWSTEHFCKWFEQKNWKQNVRMILLMIICVCCLFIHYHWIDLHLNIESIIFLYMFCICYLIICM